jgi:hypothetical protein
MHEFSNYDIHGGDCCVPRNFNMWLLEEIVILYVVHVYPQACHIYGLRLCRGQNVCLNLINTKLQSD